jgi:enamine deaminase RidA (YjgF/YER057c/UK114 family)
MEQMKRTKDISDHGVPWEGEYGYTQAVKVGSTIYVSGQFSHDEEGNFITPAPVDADGNILDHSNMEIQMQQTYKMAEKILGHYGANLDNVVEEVIYVTNMDAAMAVAGRVRKKAYKSQKPEVSSTLLVTPRLAQPHQLVEIKFIAKIERK